MAAEFAKPQEINSPDKKEFETIKGAYTFSNPRYADDRGDYVNISTQMAVLEAGSAVSRKNVLRGMHCSPFPKVVACLSGEMFDVLLDLRVDSPSFGKWEQCTLKGDNRFLFVPPNVAHGYLAVEDNTLTLYFKGGLFDPIKEVNINPYDETLNIPWPGDKSEHVITEKDKGLQSLSDFIAAHPVLSRGFKKVGGPGTAHPVLSRGYKKVG